MAILNPKTILDERGNSLPTNLDVQSPDLLTIRRGNEGPIQVSRQAYQNTYSQPSSGGFEIVPPQTSPNLPTGAGSADPAAGAGLGDGLGTDIKSFLTQYGFKTPDPKQSPMTAFADTFQQLYDKMGLTTVKGNYDSLVKEYDTLGQQKLQEIANIKDNPFLSEGLANAKINQLNQNYAAKENALTNKLKLLQGIFEGGREDAKFIAQQSLTEANRGAQLNENIILKAIDFVEKQAESRRKLQEPFELSEGQARYVYDPATGLFKQQALRPKTIAPKEAAAPKITGSDKTGRWQFNPKTGKYDIPVTPPVNPTGKAPSTNKSTLSKDEQDFAKDIATAQKDLNSGRAWGEIWNRMFSKWGSNKPKAQQDALGQVLDKQLNAEFWSQRGAYERLKASR